MHQGQSESLSLNSKKGFIVKCLIVQLPFPYYMTKQSPQVTLMGPNSQVPPRAQGVPPLISTSLGGCRQSQRIHAVTRINVWPGVGVLYFCCGLRRFAAVVGVGDEERRALVVRYHLSSSNNRRRRRLPLVEHRCVIQADSHMAR